MFKYVTIGQPILECQYCSTIIHTKCCKMVKFSCNILLGYGFEKNVCLSLNRATTHSAHGKTISQTNFMTMTVLEMAVFYNLFQTH